MEVPLAVIDGFYRLAYRTAYRLLRVYWRATRPETHGALVALWWQGQVLLVRQSYVPYLSFPGGYVRDGETAQAAAARELREEVGLSVRPEQLRQVLDTRHDWEGKRDHVEIFALEVEERPRVAVDNREVVAADFYPPERALALELFPPVREAIIARVR